MRYLYLIAFASCMAMPTESSHASEPTADQRLSRRPLSASPQAALTGAPAPEQHGAIPFDEGLFVDSGLARFQMRGGRLRMDPVRYRKGNQDHRSERFQESLSVSCSNGVPSASFQYQDDFQKIQMSVQYGRCFRMQSTILATGETAALQQDQGQLIRWETRRSPSASNPLDRQANGWTLLHIIAADEPGFRLHFDHLLFRMFRGRSVFELTHRTHQLMCQKLTCQNTSDLVVVTETNIDQLIQQLSARKSSARRDAALQLSRLGASAFPHLHAAVREKDLDAEQLTRIKKLLANESRVENDTPSSLACLLSADHHHWQLLASRLNQQEWLAAKNHIRNCKLQPLLR